MATVKKTLPAKSNAAVLKTIAELMHSIVVIDEQLTEMTASRLSFCKIPIHSNSFRHNFNRMPFFKMCV